MITRDYILRQVQQMVSVLAQVSLKCQAQEYHLARDILAQTIQEITGLDPARIRTLTLDELLSVCGNDSEFSSEIAPGLADLLREDGFLQPELGNQETAKESWKRAIWLYEAVSGSGGVVPMDLVQRLSRLTSLLQKGS